MQLDMGFTVTKERQEVAEKEIIENRKIMDYDIREYPIGIIVSKFEEGLSEDESELYIPDYQREFIWPTINQSRFIESILLNLPIPYIFVGDTPEGKYEGRLEIIDGSQRIRTVIAFVNNELELHDLKKLPSLNGFKFRDLTHPRQMRFMRKTLRMIELTDQADEEARREMFDRLNTGGKDLTKMEQRKGTQDGPFYKFVEKCSKLPLFRELCPISTVREKRAEYPELVLRYFAYLNDYRNFDKSVNDFLNDYLSDMNKSEFNDTLMMNEFTDMLSFIHRHFRYGFKKNANNKSVPRIRFEAIAVGTSLALRENPNAAPDSPTNWLISKEFLIHTRSDASNSRPKVRNRIHFVRDNLLNRDIEQE